MVIERKRCGAACAGPPERKSSGGGGKKPAVDHKQAQQNEPHAGEFETLQPFGEE